MASQRLQVGVIGGGDVAQVVHLPTLIFLSELYTTVAICDASLKTAKHCAARFHIPFATNNAEDIINNPDIDMIFNLAPDEFHAPYTIAALKQGKNVFLEKPLTLSLSAGQKILEAEKSAPNGARVFVGYMRRYAASFAAFKREVSSIESIKYARVRDIIGPNSYFIGQSGAFSVKHTDDIPEAGRQEKQKLLQALLSEAWGAPFEELSRAQLDYSTLLPCLGSHGLSLMREALGGLPKSVIASTDNDRWYTTMFEYRDKSAEKDRFTCLYESGIDNVPRFDSHVVIFGENKTVTIRYDTPFVKGLGIKVEVDELNEFGEKIHREIQTSYEDAYTLELKQLHDCMTKNSAIKTNVEDAMQDMILFDMMMKAYPAHKRDRALEGDSIGFMPSGP